MGWRVCASTVWNPPTVSKFSSAAVTLTATLKVADDPSYVRLPLNPIALRTITLQRRPKGISSWTSVGTMPHGATSGTYTKIQNVSASTEFRAVFSKPADEGLHAGIVRGFDAAAAGHAEGADLRVLQLHLAHVAEERRVFRVRQWESAFDVIHAELVELLRDHHLVLKREVEPLALRAVAKGRVVDLDASCGAHRGHQV